MANVTRALRMPDNSEYEFFGRYYYGTSDGTATGSSSIISTSVPGFTSESLVEGVRVFIRFANPPNLYVPKLSVNGTAAKPITYSKTYEESGSTDLANIMKTAWTADEIVEFVYDGTHWRIANTPKIWWGECYTNENTIIKECTIGGFVPSEHMQPGTIINILFYNNGPAPSGSNTLALRINGYTYYQDVKITPDGGRAEIHKGVNSFICYKKTSTTGEYIWLPLDRPVDSSYASDDKTISSSAKIVKDLYSLVPTKVSALSNDRGYLTLSDLPIYDGTVV